MCSCSSIVEKKQKNDSMYIDPIHWQHWQMDFLVHLKILRSTMCKIPGFQDLAESISRIQGQKNQGPFRGSKPKFKGFSRIPGFPGPLVTLINGHIFIIIIYFNLTFFIKSQWNKVLSLVLPCCKCYYFFSNLLAIFQFVKCEAIFNRKKVVTLVLGLVCWITNAVVAIVHVNIFLENIR